MTAVEEVGARCAAFSTRDPDEAEQFLTAAYSRMRSSAQRPGFRFSHARTDARQFSLDSVFVSRPTALEVDPIDQLVVVRVESGSLRRRTAGADEVLVAGDLFLTALPGTGASHVVTDWHGHSRTQVLTPELLSAAATIDPEQPCVPRFTGLRAATPDGAGQWERLVRHAEQTLMNPEAASSPLVISSLARLLAATALLVFPHEALPERRCAQTQLHARTLRRAVAFIEANPDSEITVADIAAACHVTTRAVQLAFQRHLGTTPMGYLRRVRLDQAHRELLAARPGDGTTVAGVAYRWGFSSPSRFATQYRQAFGRYPSRTLRGQAGG